MDILLKVAVPTWRQQAFESKMAHFNSKAEKLGLEPLTATFVEKKIIQKGEEVYKTAQYVICGQLPVISGWSLVGKVNFEHSRPMFTIVSAPAGMTKQALYERYKDSDTTCEHCNTVRKRSEVIILANGDGHLKQVGTTCIDSFLGAHKAESQIRMFSDLYEWVEVFQDPESEEFFSGSSRHMQMNLQSYLEVVAYLSRVDGFSSKANAEYGCSTSEIALHLIGSTRSNVREKVTSADKEMASAAIVWSAALKADSESYLDKISIIAEDGWFNVVKEAGLAASMVKAYGKHLESTAAAAEVPEVYDYLPGVKEKQRLKGVNLYTKVCKWKDNAWGGSYFHIFRTEDGHMVKASTSKAFNHPEGFLADFTVKALEPWNGDRFTTVTRITDVSASLAEKFQAALQDLYHACCGTDTFEKLDQVDIDSTSCWHMDSYNLDVCASGDHVIIIDPRDTDEPYWRYRLPADATALIKKVMKTHKAWQAVA